MVAKQNPSNGFCIAIVTGFGPCRGFPNRIQGGCCSHDDVNKPVRTECLNNNLLYNVAFVWKRRYMPCDYQARYSTDNIQYACVETYIYMCF